MAARIFDAVRAQADPFLANEEAAPPGSTCCSAADIVRA
jgi:hypothetical protein